MRRFGWVGGSASGSQVRRARSTTEPWQDHAEAVG
jgi:hypothetical protein